MPQQQLTLRIQIILYTLAAFAICILMIDQYRQGLFSLVLSNAIAVPAFLFSAIYIYINRDHTPALWVHHILISVLSLLALYQLTEFPELMTHYLYALPLFSFFCLPILNATILNLVVAMITTSMMWNEFGWQEGLRSGINYCLFLGSAFCYAYLTQVKQKSLRRLALTDPVSGAYNKRHFYHTLDREISRSENTQDPISLIALTIDDYHQMMDIHGRRSMDQFLSQFTDRSRSIIRAGDEVFRLEEDLFILLLPHCTNDGAIVLMERIKRNLQQQSWDPVAELSLSTSAATWSTGETAQELQKRLLQSLTKQQKTTLQLAAFSEQ
ncbi:MAG: GGDEF domain-containing protein [Oleispira sp.]|nr:GGDEF domain-containing protein [Oleispira sp.]MBL4881072.1 GGDEF domain-containing protein [Oleispira sp.]